MALNMSNVSESIVLERVDVHLNKVVSETKNQIYMQDTEVRMMQLHDVADSFVIMLRGWFLGKQFPDKSEYGEISVSDGPWECFKEKYAPKWFLKRWPVKYREIRYESARSHYNVCPHWAEDFHRDKIPHLMWMAERKYEKKPAEEE